MHALFLSTIKIVFASMPSLSGLSSHVDEMCLIIESLAQGLSFMKFSELWKYTLYVISL